jgi:putative CocE/NonD family hydrolase
MKIVLFIVAICLFSAKTFAQHPFNIVKEKVKIPMRDGINLGATLYRPEEEGRYPAIVFRTPYGKDDYDSSASFPAKAAKEGYLVFLVDVRGRYTSDGNFEAYRQEKKDGYDVIEWVGKSPHCDGKVGTYGQSYPGFVQWLALSQGPPSLKAAAPAMTPIHSHQFFYVGGAFSYTWLDWFMPLILPDLRKRANDTSGPWDYEAADKAWQVEKMDWYRYRPLAENPLLKKYAPYYYDWLKNQDRTDFWEFANVENDFPKMKAAILLVSGWYDSAYGPPGAIDGFLKIRKEGGSEIARKESRLVLGPWPHSGHNDIRKTKFGIQEFGPSASIDYDAYLLDWFGKHLKGKNEASSPPVSLFVMGANEWRYENDWPIPNTREMSLYLQSNGDAAADRNNGALSQKVGSKDLPDHYVFDPSNPVFDIANERSYPYDQKDIETRKDVLVYTSEPLQEDTEVTGQIVAELFVSSSAKDTDFAITFCDVDPQGLSINLAGLDAGYLRMRYRNGFTKQELMTPGEVYKIRIDNLYTSNLFKKGHRIRLQITSSKYPHYDPNPNTGTDIPTEKNLQKATQTIYHDQKYPSRLILPVISK